MKDNILEVKTMQRDIGNTLSVICIANTPSSSPPPPNLSAVFSLSHFLKCKYFQICKYIKLWYPQMNRQITPCKKIQSPEINQIT